MHPGPMAVGGPVQEDDSPVADARDDGARWRFLRSRWFRWGAGMAVIAVGAVVFWWWVLIPNPLRLDHRNPTRTALMEQRIDEALADGDSLEVAHRWVDLGHMSQTLRRAVIVAEDYRFREHRGVDWVSLAEEVRWSGGDRLSWTRPADLRALWDAVTYAWSHRDEIRGRSTITQQLAKNLYFGTERTFLRKALELVVAARLERRLGKDRILELYLNVVELGPGIFGAEAAAQHYFGRSAADLTLPEAAALAGTLPHPLASNPAYRPSRMRWRQEMILERLAPRVPPVDSLPPVSEPDLDLGVEIPDPTSIRSTPMVPDSGSRGQSPAVSADTGRAGIGGTASEGSR